MNSHGNPRSKPRSHPSSSRNTEHIVRVFGYCRVSTDMQVQHGLSLDAQREEIKRVAADRGWSSRKFSSTVVSQQRTPTGPRFNG